MLGKRFMQNSGSQAEIMGGYLQILSDIYQILSDFREYMYVV